MIKRLDKLRSNSLDSSEKECTTNAGLMNQPVVRLSEFWMMFKERMTQLMATADVSDEKKLCNQLLKAAKTALARFNEQNGQVSYEIWCDNFQAMADLRDAIAAAEGEVG